MWPRTGIILWFWGGRVDMDRLIEFVTQFNEFINHQPKPFSRMIGREMKL